MLPKDKLTKIRKHATAVANDLDKIMSKYAVTNPQFVALDEARTHAIEAVNALVRATGEGE